MQKLIELTINGKKYQLEVSPGELLIDLLRDRMGLTGAKKGCGSGDCGACTVIIDGKPMVSCLTLAATCQDKKITTIEGLSFNNNNMHTLQEAFIRTGAVQCGYCTPGILMTAKALLDENPRPSDDQIKKALSGNLCRCTGYTKIIQAVKEASKEICGEER